jgi:hypothetical protein
MHKPQLHCSLSQRAWTDLITNSTLLSGVDVAESLSGLLGWGRFPKRALSAFLHESIHHWCFLSPLGSALSLLQLRAFRRAFAQMIGEGDADLFDVLRDVIKVETAIAFLRPLAEGLALFAEFDVTPSPDLTMFSTPMQWTYFLFTRPTKDELQTQTAFSLYKLLWDLRLSEAYIRHKANLLIQPISCDAGGYLPGYIGIKQLWAFAVSRSEQFVEADFFLSFIQNYVYNDYGFVSILLDDTLEDLAASNAVATYFQQRMGDFAQLDLPSEAAKFKAYIESLRHGEHPPDTFRINTTLEAHQAGNSCLDAFVEDLQGSDAPESLTDVLKALHALVIAQRDIMCLGSAEVSVKLPSAGWLEAWIGEDMLIDGAVLPGIEVQAGPASLDIYVSLSGWYRVACISASGRVLMLQFFGDIDDATRRQFQGYVTDRQRTDANSEAERSLLEAFLMQSAVSPILTHIREFLRSGPTQYYLNLALLHAPETSLGLYLDMMSDNGLLPLLDGDVSLLRALALASLCASLGFNSETISAEFGRRGMNFAESMSRLKELSQQHEVPFLVEIEDRFVSLV